MVKLGGDLQTHEAGIGHGSSPRDLEEETEDLADKVKQQMLIFKKTPSRVNPTCLLAVLYIA